MADVPKKVNAEGTTSTREIRKSRLKLCGVSCACQTSQTMKHHVYPAPNFLEDPYDGYMKSVFLVLVYYHTLDPFVIGCFHRVAEQTQAR